MGTRVGSQSFDRLLHHGARCPPFALLVVEESNGCLDDALQKRLLVTRLLEPKVFYQVVAVVELAPIE